MIREEPNSVLPGHGIEAYTSELVVHPGDRLEVMASGMGETRIDVARLIHGDPNTSGPGYKEEAVPWFEGKTLDLSPQGIDFGSFVRIPGSRGFLGDNGFTFCVWILPTLLNPGWNTIVAQWDSGDVGFGVFAAGKTLVAGVSTDGSAVDWVTAKEFVYPDIWQMIGFSFDPANGSASLFQFFRSDHPRATREELVVSEQTLDQHSVHASEADIHMGALPAIHPGQTGHWAHFNGKLSSPFIVARALSAAEVEATADGVDLDLPLIARWDLSREVGTTKVVDVSGNDHHGWAVNLPTRAVTGVEYEKGRRYVREGSYSRDPLSYDAIHLHEDDLDDAGWDPVAAISLPSDVRSGIYSVRLTRGDDDVHLPFVVSPVQAEGPLVVLMPTLTWSAYSTNRSPYSYTREPVLDRGNSLYNAHTDGSPNYYVTRRRPTRAHDPTRGFEQRGAHKITANLYLIDWLEQQGMGYDVTSDDDLHQRGIDALGDSRCLLIGSHPEYWTPEMLAALEAYLGAGGRIVYMGAEFLLWIATIDPERPYIMEVRKSHGGDYHPTLPRGVGEAEHSTAPVLGGEWAERGRHARNITGVEVSAQAWSTIPEKGRDDGFWRMPVSESPPYQWVFEGVEEDPIGRYGLNFGSASWMEMDGALPGESLPDVERTVLARARSGVFWSPLAEDPTADIVLSTWPNGAAVFAAGSLTWTGSLSANGYRNGISRITDNVIARFLERPVGASVLD